MFLGYHIQPTEGKWLYTQLGNFTLKIFSFEKWYIFHRWRCLFLFVNVFCCQENCKCRTKKKCNFRDSHTLSMMFLVFLPNYPFHALIIIPSLGWYREQNCGSWGFFILGFLFKASNILRLKTLQNRKFCYKKPNENNKLLCYLGCEWPACMPMLYVRPSLPHFTKWCFNLERDIKNCVSSGRTARVYPTIF